MGTWAAQSYFSQQDWESSVKSFPWHTVISIFK